MNRDELYFDVCRLISTVCSPFLKILSWNFHCALTWPCSLVFVAVSQKVRLNVAPMPKSVFCLFFCYFPSNWVEIACVMPGDPTHIDQVSDHWSSSKSKVTLMAMLHWTERGQKCRFFNIVRIGWKLEEIFIKFLSVMFFKCNSFPW